MFLSSIDLLSPEITLFYLNQKRHFQIVSGILALLTYVTVFAFSVYFFMDFFNKKNPTSYFFNKFVEDAGFFPFNTSSMFHYVSFEHSDTDFTKVMIIGIPDVITTYQNGFVFTENIHWVYEKCEMSDVKGIEYVIENNTKFTHGACIRKVWNVDDQRYYTQGDEKFYYPSLEKGASHPNRTAYGIIIGRCRSDLPESNIVCDKKENIDEYFLNQGLELSIVDHEIDVGNYSTPNIKSLYKVTNGMFLDTYATNHLNFNPALIRTHSGIVFEAISEETSYVFDQNEKITTATGDSEILCAFFFWMQNRLQIYERTYIRIQDVLANIGGVSKIIMTIAIILNSFFHEYGVLEDTRKLCIPYVSNETAKKTIQSSFVSGNLMPFSGESGARTRGTKKTNYRTENSIITPLSSQIPLKGQNIWFKKLSIFGYLHRQYFSSEKKRRNFIFQKIALIRKKYLNEELLCKLYFLMEKNKYCFNGGGMTNNKSNLEERSLIGNIKDSKIFINKFNSEHIK